MGNRRKPVKKGGGGGGGGVGKKKGGVSKDQIEFFCNTRTVEGDNMFRDKKFLGARVVYEEALRYSAKINLPDTAVLHKKIAECVMEDVPIDYEAVISHCSQALELNPNMGEALFMRARAFEAKKEYEGAMKDVKSLLVAEPNHVDALKIAQRLKALQRHTSRKQKKETKTEVRVPILVDTHENNSSSSNSSKRLLCVICLCSHNTSPLSLDKFNIFIVDLNGGGGGSSYVKRVPNIRLQGFSITYMFCNIGSDLYMLKGGSGDRPVFKYALDNADHLKSEIVVEKSLEPYSHILNPKRSPAVAIPTPDDKILVFSLHVYFYDLPLIKEDKIRCQPELFDPKTKSWTLLPPLCIRQTETDSNYQILDGYGSWTKFGRSYTPIRSRSDSFLMASYFFISKSTLLVNIVSKSFEKEGHWLTLDIHSLEGWKLYDGWNTCKDDPHKFVNEMLIVNNGRIDCELQLPAVGFKFPPIEEENVSNQRMILSDYVKDKDKEFCFAAASAGPEMYDYTRSFLIVDEWEYEFTEAGVSTGTCACIPKKQIKPPFKFVISDVCGYFLIHSAFMLPQPSFLI